MLTDKEYYKLAYNLVDETEKVTVPLLTFFAYRSDVVTKPPPYDFFGPKAFPAGGPGAAAYDENTGVMHFGEMPIMSAAYEAYLFYEDNGYMSDECKEWVKKAYAEFVSEIAHEFTHYEQHAKAGWDKNKAFPPESFKLEYMERPFEKEAWAVGLKWREITRRTLLGEQTELSDVTRQIVRS